MQAESLEVLEKASVAPALEVLALDTGSVRQLAGHHGGLRVRAHPFDAIELELSALWS